MAPTEETLNERSIRIGDPDAYPHDPEIEGSSDVPR